MKLNTLKGACAGALLALASMSYAAMPLDFDELYGQFSPLGLTFSEKIIQNQGNEIQIEGFMAPPLKAEAQFFVLTKMPMSVCPFCSSDADWPADIIVVYLGKKQTFVDFNRRIRVRGVLDIGSWIDPDTGFVSQLRLRQAEFKTL